MTNRSAFVVVAVIAAALLGCGSVEVQGLAVGDGGADQVAGDLDAAPSEPSAENPSDGAAVEVLPDAGVDLGGELPPAPPSCERVETQGAECRPGCSRCLGGNFQLLAKPGEPCAAPGGLLCVAACPDCP